MRRDAIGLQLSLDVEGKHAVVVGGNAEAADKAQRLLDGEAWVTIVAPAAGPEVVTLHQGGRVILLPRAFQRADVATAHLVLVCERDAALVEEARAAAEETGAAFWATDTPEPSDFAMPALARLGRARIAISTGGAAPALASKLREACERDLGARFAAFVDRLGAERERLLAEEPDAERRRERLRALLSGLEVSISVKYPEDFSPPE